MTAVEGTLTAEQAADRRLGRWLVLGLVLALVLFGTGVALAQRYEPLEPGSSSAQGDGDLVTDDTTGGELVRVPYRPGETVHVIVSVRNTGRFGVTVDGVLPDVGTGFGLVGASGLRADGKNPLVDAVRLPFDLGAGKEVALRLAYRVPDCGLGAGSRHSYATVPVSWHAFRSSHVTFLPMTPVQLEVPTGVRSKPCPR